MKAIVVTNQKGGVAKTTSTINLAGAAPSQGPDVLAIDADPPGYLTNNLGLRDAYSADPPTFFELWEEPTHDDDTTDDSSAGSGDSSGSQDDGADSGGSSGSDDDSDSGDCSFGGSSPSGTYPPSGMC